MFCKHEEGALVKAFCTTASGHGRCNDRARAYGLYSGAHERAGINAGFRIVGGAEGDRTPGLQECLVTSLSASDCPLVRMPEICWAAVKVITDPPHIGESPDSSVDAVRVRKRKQGHSVFAGILAKLALQSRNDVDG